MLTKTQLESVFSAEKNLRKNLKRYTDRDRYHNITSNLKDEIDWVVEQVLGKYCNATMELSFKEKGQSEGIECVYGENIGNKIKLYRTDGFYHFMREYRCFGKAIRDIVGTFFHTSLTITKIPLKLHWGKILMGIFLSPSIRQQGAKRGELRN
ncbi:hypothetical protein RsTz2092_09380 [Deferribacterales bacterium RsTz2092]|nr:hypothetical protein AGMMS49941_12940 [Deferribacterales bacterium]